MTDDQIKAFLDDLARISLRHGVVVEPLIGFTIAPLPQDFGGYFQREVYRGGGVRRTPANARDCGVFRAGFGDLRRAPWGDATGEELPRSLDVSKLSNHERLKIIGGKA